VNIPKFVERNAARAVVTTANLDSTDSSISSSEHSRQKSSAKENWGAQVCVEYRCPLIIGCLDDWRLFLVHGCVVHQYVDTAEFGINFREHPANVLCAP
jgi:hypothetical protein